jgi:hypothetical protein
MHYGNNNVLNEITSSSLNLPSLKSSEALNQNKNNCNNENEEKIQQQNTKLEKIQKVSKYNAISNNKQIEIWSRTARKLLESTLKKAILNNNLIKFNKLNYPNENVGVILGSASATSMSPNNHNKYQRVTSPPSSSTLKRHTDIKINLSKILDRKAYDFLININGSYIKHNCTNVNKHGVVINTEEDFPSWLVKAMSTLILWENENESISIDEQFPKFEDIYNEILSYFSGLKEPLMSKEMTNLFIEILKLLIEPKESINLPKLLHQEKNYTRGHRKISNSLKKSCSFEFSKLEKCLPDMSEQFSGNFFVQSTSTLTANIENLVNILKGKHI